MYVRKRGEIRHVLVLHLYYIEHIERALKEVQDCVHLVDVIITCMPFLKAHVRRCANKLRLKVSIKCFDNKGMDILPFILLLPELSCHYDIVTKIHFKKEEDFVDYVWNNEGASKLISRSVIEHVNKLFSENDTVSIAGIAAFYFSCGNLMLNNSENFSMLRTQISDVRGDWASCGFFAGTNFTLRPQKLLELCKWVQSHLSLFNEPYKKDGNFSNALERIFALFCTKNSKLGLIFSHKNTLFSKVCSPSEYVSFASTREITNALTNLDDDLRDLGALLEHKQRNTDDSWNGNKAYYPLYYLQLEQFLPNCSQLEAFRILKYQRATINWEEVSSRARVSGKVSIVIPVYNQSELTESCVNSIFRYSSSELLEVIAVDNGSDAMTKVKLEELTKKYELFKVVTLDKNQNFSFGCNIGFTKSNGEFVIFLNNDVEVSENWLEPLLEPVKSGEVFATQPLLLYPDGTIQSAGIGFNNSSCIGYSIYNGLPAAFAEKIHNKYFRAITAACMCISAINFSSVEGFSPVYVNGQEDIDLCLKLHNYTGLDAKLVPASQLIHYESKSEGRFDNVLANRHVFVKRWANSIIGDDLERYTQDDIFIKSWNTDKRNVPFWIKSCIPSVEMKGLHSVSEIMSDLYQSDRSTDEKLMTLFHLMFQNPKLVSSFAFTLNNLLENRFASKEHVKRTLIIARNAFSWNHRFAIDLYELYKENRSSVGIVVLTKKSAIQNHQSSEYDGSPRQTSAIYMNESSLNLTDAIIHALKHPADNIHLVDASKDSLILAAIYKKLFSANVYFETLETTNILYEKCAYEGELVPLLQLVEPVRTVDFTSTLIEMCVDHGAIKVRGSKLVFFYEPSRFMAVTQLISHLQRISEEHLDVAFLCTGELARYDEIFCREKKFQVIILTNETCEELKSQVYECSYFFLPEISAFNFRLLSNIFFLSDKTFYLSLEKILACYSELTLANEDCDFSTFLRSYEFFTGRKHTVNQKIEKLRDKKLDDFISLDFKLAESLMKGSLEDFVANL